MIVEALVMLITAAAPEAPPAVVTAPASVFSRAPTPAYQPETRAVDNWRRESALALEMSPADAAKRALGFEERDPARCVKLNNYWCIKRAGWNGEIAADADGHVGFASAEEGAAVAALLLRRYYVDYKRRTARAIVERWAPAQCSPVFGRPLAGPPASRAGLARMLPQRVVPMGLAPRGIENTLRARWLAAHGRGGVGGAGPTRGARFDALDMIETPTIMAGISKTRAKRREKPGPASAAPLSDTVAALPTAPTLNGVADCSSELARIVSYAARVAGDAVGPNDDLMLFDAAGLPTGNLAKAMANMAAVEIGPARPRMGLITAAVAQLKRLLTEPQPPDVAAR